MGRPLNDPLKELARAYFGQAFDTVTRLLQLVPSGERKRYVQALLLGLHALDTLSEDELADPTPHERRLAEAVGTAYQAAVASGRARRDGPSQAYPSEGP